MTEVHFGELASVDLRRANGTGKCMLRGSQVNLVNWACSGGSSGNTSPDNTMMISSDCLRIMRTAWSGTRSLARI